jgi:hypothetical protein
LILIFTFLKPAFADIKVKQDDLFQYKDTVSKVEELNRALRELMTTKNAFSQNDLNTLNTFIPNSIDTLKVMRDIEAIFVELKKPLLSLTSKEIVAPQSNTDVEFESAIETPEPSTSTKTSYQDFDITFVGTYFDAKTMLEMIERNETLLELINVSLNPLTNEVLDNATVTKNIKDDLFNVTLTVRTFGLSS